MRSPHARGSTAKSPQSDCPEWAFSARAGINRRIVLAVRSSGRVLRTRGDQAVRDQTEALGAMWRSPHARGSTVGAYTPIANEKAFSARAGINRWLALLLDGKIRRSPHARGSTAVSARINDPAAAFSARAGINRAGSWSTSSGYRVLRTRGDQPSSFIPKERIKKAFSPHARGSTALGYHPIGRAPAFSARAGINRTLLRSRPRSTSVLRTRGDQPQNLIPGAVH